MQNIDPKERPKLYALIAAAVVVFGFVGKSLYDVIVPPARPNAEPQGPAPVRAGADPTPVTTGATGGAATPAATGNTFNPDKISPRYQRDPFAPVPDDVLAEEARKTLIVSAAPSPDPNTNINKPSPFSSIINLPSTVARTAKAIDQHNRDIDLISREVGVVGDQGGRVPAVEVTPETPPYTVTGVLIGEPGGRDVAILNRTGATERRFVVVGDQLENGFKVTAIESDGVRIKNPGFADSEFKLPRQANVKPTTVTLPLGGDVTPAAK